MERQKIDFTKTGLYLLLTLCSGALFFIGENGEPFPLALSYAMMGAGLSLPLSILVGTLPPLLRGDFPLLLLYLCQNALVAFGYFLQRHLSPDKPLKTGLFPMLALSLSLGGFVAFFPFEPYLLPFFGLLELHSIIQKVLLAGVIFLLSTAFYVALRAVLKKLLKCRLRNDEILFCVLLYTLVGIGLCRFLSVNAYLGIAFFLLLLFANTTKDSSTLLCAFCLSLPPLITAGLSPDRLFVYGVAVALFIKSGRVAAVCALLAVFFVYGYLDGLYAYPTSLLIQTLLSALLPCLVFILLPAPLLRALENKLIFYREKHLSRIAINRNRLAVGEKLFEISYVFREIERAFLSINNDDAEVGAREYIRTCVLNEVCEQCQECANCRRQGLLASLDKLIEVGCLKGRASLIDIPRALADICINQNGILYALNRQFVDYRTYLTDAENARSGRTLLAGQAQGVSEILRNLALEQSQPLPLYTEKERSLIVALLGVGIVCSEVLIYGEENDLTLSLITFGQADVKKLATVASHHLGIELMISEKLTLSNDKYCCILRKKPVYDAAFGVAFAKKKGESVSGDTHSVIKLDERKFMVALADGMGSGEYAHRIADSTISLLESFYRAKMPSPLVLSAVNKLMTFNKEEAFVCVDVAIIDLDDGRADVVKIGSPLGFILSGNTIKVLESTSLPMGILDALRPDYGSYLLQENDLLLFLSDGVADAFGSHADLYELLRSAPQSNPQQLADYVLERALAEYHGTPKDDMTAVAIRLFKNRSVA